MLNRCDWCLTDPLLKKYHDIEWGVPLHDDCRHYEFLVLESAQGGLSWLTVLRKREGYRRHFAGFDPVKVAMFSGQEIKTMLHDRGVIRNRAKLEAAVHNAGCVLDIQAEHGSFSRWLWNFVDGIPVQPRRLRASQWPTTTDLSDRVSKELKHRGFRFLGSTVIYAHLQAAGLVNDHLVGCFRHQAIAEKTIASAPASLG